MSEPAMTPDGGVARLPMSWEMYESLEYDDELRGAEYMDGELLLPPGAPDLHHQDVILYLRDQLLMTLKPEEKATTGVGWKPAGVSEEYIPDLIVYPKSADRRRFTGVPVLVVEVTSSNWQNDMVRKRAKYAAAGLRDYWIVDRRGQALRCHELHQGVLVETSTLRREEHGGVVRASYAGGREVELDLSQLFV